MEELDAKRLPRSHMTENGTEVVARSSIFPFGRPCASVADGGADMTSIRFLIHASIIVLTAATAVPASIEGRDDPPVRLFQERTYLGRPMTYWLKVLRDRDEESMSLAFDAIHSLGQGAWVAV